MVGCDVMMMFGGSPTGVAHPPMLACTTIAIRIGTGFKSKSSQSVMVIGAIRRTVETLSSNIDIKHVMMQRQWISGQIFPSVIYQRIVMNCLLVRCHQSTHPVSINCEMVEHPSFCQNPDQDHH